MERSVGSLMTAHSPQPSLRFPILRNGDRHVVETLSSMIGKDSANIVIANALMLNGAMIANAERDERGQYTDHGNLVLKFGKLISPICYELIHPCIYLLTSSPFAH